MMMYMLFPDAKRKALTFSYDDGVDRMPASWRSSTSTA